LRLEKLEEEQPELEVLEEEAAESLQMGSRLRLAVRAFPAPFASPLDTC